MISFSASHHQSLLFFLPNTYWLKFLHSWGFIKLLSFFICTSTRAYVLVLELLVWSSSFPSDTLQPDPCHWGQSLTMAILWLKCFKSASHKHGKKKNKLIFHDRKYVAPCQLFQTWCSVTASYQTHSWRLPVSI